MKSSIVATLIAFLLLPLSSCKSLDQKISPTARIADVGQVSAEFSTSLASAAAAAKKNAAGKLDQHAVPHLFGETEADLYFVQGYAHAYFRLWQMETLSRIVEGRIAEIIGERGVASDKASFYFDLPEVAGRSHEKQMRDPDVRKKTEAYVEGINIRIDQLAKLGDSRLPTEYRVSGVRPRKFTTLDVARIVYFSNMTAGDPYSELRLTKSRGKLGPEIFKELYPWPTTNTVPSELFGPADTGAMKRDRAPSTPSLLAENEFPVDPVAGTWLRGRPDTGSNLWVFDRQKMESGEPLIANDFHMHYLLPGPYLPMQLATDRFNAIGSSRPGIPGLTSGTNGKIAWGHVASLIDSQDWFRLKLNPKNPGEYRWNNRWKKFEIVRAQLPVKGSSALMLEKRISVAGPMVPAIQVKGGKNEFRELAFRWAGSEGRQILDSFLKLPLLSSSGDCHRSSRDFGWMVLTCIDVSNRQGIWTTGIVPIRPAGVDPRVLNFAERDGDLWTGELTVSQMPHSFPVRKFHGMANQKIVSHVKPSYLGWNFSPPSRAMRIDELVGKKEKWSFEEVVEMQSDTVSVRSQQALKIMMADARTMRDAKRFPCPSQLLSQLDKWDGRYLADSSSARLFNYWLLQIQELLWNRWLGSAETFEWPTAVVVVELMKAKEDHFIWNLPSTVEHEKRGDIVRWTLGRTCAQAREVAGGIDKFLWKDVIRPSFKSVSGISYKEEKLDVSGSTFSLFSQSGDHGTAYRWLATLGPKPRYWFASVAGIDGDPESALSVSWLKSWANREVLEIPFYSADEIKTSK